MNLKRSLVFLGWLFFASVPALHAGVASLTDAEVLRLKTLVQSSPEAGIWEDTILRHAKEALGLTPNPIAEIQTAGKLKGSDEKTKTQEALRDMPRMRDLGLAYALTGDANYLNQGLAYLKAWAQTCQPPTDPINATQLEPLLETYDLLRPHAAPADRQALDAWVRSIAQTLLEADDPRKGSHWNNHQTHRLKTIALAAFTLNDAGLEKQTLESLKTLMERNLNPEGTTFDFLQRDALHYHFYDLEPYIRTAFLYQRAQNVDLYNYKTDRGVSVSQCLAWGLPFARGEKTHAEFVNSTVTFDVQRGANGEASYVSGSAFNPKDALRCLELAQYYLPELKALVGTLADKPGSAYPTLQCFLNEAMRPGPPPAASASLTMAQAVATDAAAVYHFALIDYQQGQYNQAVTAFQKVIQENPNSWQAYQGLGSAFLKTGDKEVARQAYQKCLELNPNNPPVKTALESLGSAPVTQSVLDTLGKEPFFDDFNTIDPALWMKQDWTFPDSASYEKPSQVSAQDSILTVRVERTDQPVQGRTCLAGGLKSYRLFTYGKFSTRMKNQLVPGVDNSFFLMSPWQSSGWHHQELDFEFLGKNPSQVQVNVHKYVDQEGTIANGGQLPKMIDLGFDSNQDYHVYTIEWLRDRINFIVDGKTVWTETRNLPDLGLNLFLGSFVVNQDNGWGPQWAGKFDPQTLPAAAMYDWVKYEPE
jgi:beta-glucanase (GH16 family)